MKTFLRTAFVALFSVLILASCKGLNINGLDLGRATEIGKRAFTTSNMSLEEEQKVGAQMTSIILGGAPLLKEKSLLRYVSKVGHWVASQGERDDIQWRFGVIESDSINAFAMPGGYVLITEGLLSILNNEAELAAVLAHEIAHINRSHHLKAMEKNNQLSLFSDLALFAGDVYSVKSAKQNNRQFFQNKALAEKLLNTTKTLYSKGLERDDEFDADDHAIVLIARAGYDPYAFTDVLQKLSQFSREDGQLQLLFNTHPEPQLRLLNTERIYDSLTSTNRKGQLLGKRFQQQKR